MRYRSYSATPTVMPWQSALGIAIASAGLMYLLDPVNGRRRRGLARDKLTHYARVASVGSRRATSDLGHRARGALANVRTRLHAREAVPDEVLAERVRSKMGVVVSHPHALQVHAHDGVVTLSGAILRNEAGKLLWSTRRVPGVKHVVDWLERHKHTENLPMLQGGSPRIRKPELLQEHWTPGVRLAAALAAGAIVYVGLEQRGTARLLTTGFGTGLLLRSLTNLSTERMLGVRRSAPGIEFQKTIYIDAPVEHVFSFFKNFENLPSFMSHLESVDVNGDESRWSALGPAGVRTTWRARTSRLKDNELIAWQSLPGSSVQTAGSVRFESDPRGGTRLSVRMSYSPPAGAFGHVLAVLFGADPKRALDDDLLRLKSLLEKGKTTSESRVHGEINPEPAAAPRVPEYHANPT